MKLNICLYKDLILNDTRFKIYRVKDNRRKVLKFAVLEQIVDRRDNSKYWIPIDTYNNPRESLKNIKKQFEE